MRSIVLLGCQFASPAEPMMHNVVAVFDHSPEELSADPLMAQSESLVVIGLRGERHSSAGTPVAIQLQRDDSTPSACDHWCDA